MVIILFYSLIALATECIPATTKVPLPNPDVYLNYLRVSPDGKYIIYNDSADNVFLGEVKLDTTPPSIEIYKTPLKNEAYPVEPDWEFISSPYDNGKARMYKLSDILQLQDKAKSVYDDDVNEFYHSIGGKGDRFQVTLWSYLISQDYKVEAGKITPSGKPYQICHNLTRYTAREQEYVNWFVLNTEKTNIISESIGKEIDKLSTHNEKSKTNLSSKKVEAHSQKKRNIIIQKVLARYVKEGLISNQEAELIIWGFNHWLDMSEVEESRYSLVNPILSTDASHIAGVLDGTTRVFEINADKTCSEVSDLKQRTSKASFAYPDSTGKTDFFAYNTKYENVEENQSQNGVYVHNISSNQSYQLYTELYREEGNISYPNFSNDGRVFFATAKDLVIMDPHQVTNGKVYDTCIKAKKTKVNSPLKSEGIQ